MLREESAGLGRVGERESASTFKSAPFPDGRVDVGAAFAPLSILGRLVFNPKEGSPGALDNVGKGEGRHIPTDPFL